MKLTSPNANGAWNRDQESNMWGRCGQVTQTDKLGGLSRHYSLW